MNKRANTWRKYTPVLCVGVLLFSLCTPVAARETALPESLTPTPETEKTTTRSPWLDDYSKRIGLTYGANATITANYIWRGLYVGGLSLQASANVGYGGLYADMWWNIGATDWAFSGFNPEVDITLGFARWGLNICVLHMHYFDHTPFFCFNNAAPGQPGNTTELRAGYRVSSKLPLSILWCTRFTGRDGYIADDGKLRRAWSSYLEVGYDFALPYQMTLAARVGMTPWKSLYTGYQGDFAVTNIDLRLMREWALSPHCGLVVMGQLMLNPRHITKDNLRWNVRHPGEQRLNANLSVGINVR